MDVTLVLKIAGVGILVSIVCQILSRTGRDEQSSLVSVAGIIIVLFMLMGEMNTLLDTVRDIFGI